MIRKVFEVVVFVLSVLWLYLNWDLEKWIVSIHFFHSGIAFQVGFACSLSTLQMIFFCPTVFLSQNPTIFNLMKSLENMGRRRRGRLLESSFYSMFWHIIDIPLHSQIAHCSKNEILVQFCKEPKNSQNSKNILKNSSFFHFWSLPLEY